MVTKDRQAESGLVPTHPKQEASLVPYIDYGKQKGQGLVLVNMGGRTGWFVRRLFPVLSTQIYLLHLRLTKTKATWRRFNTLKDARPLQWFTHIEVETFNRCNGTCSFCPVNRVADPRKPAKMTERLFASVVDQLAEVDYTGYFGLFSNNEPLLDSRLQAFASEARQRLPHAFFNLMTNGTLLDVDGFKHLMRNFDRLVIDNYNNQPQMHPNVQEIYSFCRTLEGERLLRGKTVEISLRNRQDVLSTRAGQSPNKRPPSRPLKLPCVLPYLQFVVRPDGKVSLCCNDALGEMTLGDLTRQCISEVWHGDGFADVRTRMAAHGRKGVALCSRCDFTKIDVV